MFVEDVARTVGLEAIGGEAHTTATDIVPATCLIRCEFVVAGCPAAFGVALAENEDLEGWYVTFDRKRGSVTLAREPRPRDDFWADLTGRGASYRNVDGPAVAEAPCAVESGAHALTILLDGGILEIYVDARKALTHRIARAALEAPNGRVSG
jgi:hypothetical protein